MEIQIVENEKIILDIPKPIMDLLRYAQPVLCSTVKEDLEYVIIENVRSRIDSGEFFPSPKKLTDMFKLNPVFKTVLDQEIL